MSDQEQNRPTEGMSPEERTRYWQDWMKMNMEVISLTPEPINLTLISRDDVRSAGIAHALISMHLHAIVDAWDSTVEHLIATEQMLNE